MPAPKRAGSPDSQLDGLLMEDLRAGKPGEDDDLDFDVLGFDL